MPVFPPGFDSISSESKGSSKHYTHSTGQLSTALIDSYNPLAGADLITVKSVWYGKEKDSPRHEFILIQVEDRYEAEKHGEVLINYLVLDRNVVTKPTKVGRVSTYSRTAVEGGEPADTFKVSYDGKLQPLLDDFNFTAHRLLGRLQFSSDKPLYLYELVTLAHVVSTQNPDYEAVTSNCYMFAGVIWDSLCKLYPSAILETARWKERGKNGLYRYTVTQPQVEDTCKKALEEISRAKAKIEGHKAVFEAYVQEKISMLGAAVGAPVQGSAPHD